MDSEQPTSEPQPLPTQETQGVETQSNEDSVSILHQEEVLPQSDKCRECMLLQMDIEALQERNKSMLESFTLYRRDMEAHLVAKNAEIDRLKAAVAGGREEVNTLNQTILKMTETLKSFEKTQSEQASKITQLTDDLETERAKNSQLNSQVLSLQFKVAQEKASKSIKSTAASISSSIKTISQELFSKKPEVAVINNGYAQFLDRYEADMKQLEGVTKSLEESYQQTVDAWKESETIHQAREQELLDENEALRKEKTEMEQSLQSTIQSMQLNMQEMSVQLAQTRLQYKVSDQEENNRLISRLEDDLKTKEASYKEKTDQLQTTIETLQEENTRLQGEITHLEESTNTLQTTLDSIQNADPAKVAEEETKRVLERLAQWVPDDRHYDEPGYDLQDDCVMSLLGMWQTDNSVRQTALQWMTNYMRKTSDDSVEELILQGLPFHVYEGFDQVVVPILQSRANSTIRIAQRQTVLYDMSITSGIVATPQESTERDEPMRLSATPIESNVAEAQAQTQTPAKQQWTWND